MSSRGRDLLKLSAVIALSFGLGLTLASALDLPRPGVAATSQRERPAPSAQPAVRTPPVRLADGVVPSFADLVERVNPSVVHVRTGSTSRTQVRRPRGLPPEFEPFFRFEPEERYREGSGSGFIVSRDGHVLTNNHVVEGADTIIVRLHDNREFGARLIGRDPNTDVAVIKIEARNLQPVVFGNSESTRIGDWVLAIGNPLGLDFTVTSGIVSAKGRALAGLRGGDPRGPNYSIQDFIQTDAAINPGNSGGPLINLAGEVIGVNSAIASPTGTYAGYGFAIPINLARQVMDHLIATGRVTRAILGIAIREIRPEDAEYVGLREIRGVVVNEFSDRGSPARAAGLRPGDVIVALDDAAVDHVGQLQQMVAFRRPGEVVRVTVVRREDDRAGVRRTYDVRLISADEAPQAARAEGGPSPEPGSAGGDFERSIGLRVEPLSPELVRRARLTDDQRGVLVADVEQGGPAWGRIGDGELILAVNDQRVRTPEEFNRAMRSAGRGQVVQLRIFNVETGQARIERVRARA
jgi:serine protease Do